MDLLFVGGIMNLYWIVGLALYVLKRFGFHLRPIRSLEVVPAFDWIMESTDFADGVEDIGEWSSPDAAELRH